MVKRHGNLWEKIISPENILAAYGKAYKGRKNGRGVKRFKLDEAANLERIRQCLVDRTFRTARYQEKIVYEPKKRIIYVLPFSPDRIVQHAVMGVLNPIWDKLFIPESYACRAGLGMHVGSHKTMEYVRRNRYCLKCDISKFYPSIDHEILLGIIRRKIKDEGALWLLEDIIRSFPCGKNTPIGNFCSQWFGNLYLNELDHFVKSELCIKDYLRYCDDFCLFSNDKKQLAKAREDIRRFLDDRLKLKFSKCDVFPVSHGVDFLGYRHFNNYVLLRKSTAKRVMKRLRRLPRWYSEGRIAFSRFQSSVGSTGGWLKWAKTRNLKIASKFDKVRRMIKRIRMEKKARNDG